MTKICPVTTWLYREKAAIEILTAVSIISMLIRIITTFLFARTP
jgi:hypothetical protein